MDKEIDKYQLYLDKPPRKYNLEKYQEQLDLLYRRRKNLLKTYQQKLVNFLGQQLVSSSASTLIIEDLNVHTYGTKKALARAIESMANDTALYAREVYAVQSIQKCMHIIMSILQQSQHDCFSTHRGSMHTGLIILHWQFFV